MADFPSLEPRGRRYSIGDYPLTPQKAWGVDPVRFYHGLFPVLHRLSLTYELLTAAEAAEIRDHYRSQRGGLIPFDLSANVFQGNASANGPAPLSVQWRYVSPPEETHRVGGRADVTVELESVI